ncbi:putative Gastric triacylglycerol lipase [Paratrimastix pyriformis]|uniref:Lipase n=1 Tax=Paratrimastix pyriformis TaxID=342808 RepID=A0ABQ8UX63_9EUKA|nr:putative Gastric triacylglycerol lipase [Paratrimastix pyriformis]
MAFFAVLCFLAASVLAASDADIKRNSTEVMRARGFTVDEVYFTSPDGFILLLQHMHHSPLVAHRGTILVLPGVMCSSYITVIADQAFPYDLAKQGYDIWIHNARGTTDSRRHVKWSPKDKEFWQWSLENIGMVDVPAVVEFVLQQMGERSLSAVIAHSEGTAEAFMALTSSPRAANVSTMVQRYISLNPTVFMHHVSNPLFQALATIKLPELISALGTRDFDVVDSVKKIFPWLCDIPGFCSNAVCLSVGCEGNQWNKAKLDDLAAHYPAGTSAQDIVHWAQLIRTGRFQRFDYGAAANMALYGQEEPPQFDLSKLTVPTHIFYGGRDTLSDQRDVTQYLLPALPKAALASAHLYPTYGHGDVLLNMDTPTVLYPDLYAALTM